METVWVLGFALAGSVGALLLAAGFLVLPVPIRSSLLPGLIAYATGSLLGAAFLGLLPEAIARRPAPDVLTMTLIGIFLFFVLEMLLIWRHYHADDHRHGAEDHVHRHVGGQVGPLLLIGDAVHNLADGIVIAVTFGISVSLGIASSLAIIVHEVAQEVGDFAILLDAGYRPAKAFVWNLISGLSTVVGAVVALAFTERLRPVTPYVMALAAATFIYIGLADLMPTLHRHVGVGPTVARILLMVAGALTIAVIHAVG
jgi:zinc and cadmium transporter